MTVELPSRELKEFKRFMDALKVPYRITDTTGGGHVAHSYHYAMGTGGKGLAADVTGSKPGYRTKETTAVFNAILPYSRTFAELLYNGATSAIYHFPGHDNHIHVAMPLGWKNPIKVVPVPDTPPAPVTDNPDVPNITGPIEFKFLTDPETGMCTGYYMYSQSTGEIHGHGPGAPYYGRSEDPTPV